MEWSISLVEPPINGCYICIVYRPRGWRQESTVVTYTSANVFLPYEEDLEAAEGFDVWVLDMKNVDSPPRDTNLVVRGVPSPPAAGGSLKEKVRVADGGGGGHATLISSVKKAPEKAPGLGANIKPPKWIQRRITR